MVGTLAIRAILNGDPTVTAWQITETRRLVEVAVAGLAGERPSAADLEALRHALDRTIDVATIRIWLRDPVRHHSRDTPSS